MKKCSLCGEKALEGIEICPECLKRAAVAPKQIKRLRQISNILSITADTDTNIKACMQSITEIADDLERGSYGEEEKKQESNTVINSLTLYGTDCIFRIRCLADSRICMHFLY